MAQAATVGTVSSEPIAASSEGGVPRPLILSLNADAATRLRSHPLLRQAAVRRGVTRRVVQRFFDTADFACGRAGLALGLAEIGKRRLRVFRSLHDIRPLTAAPKDSPLIGGGLAGKAIEAVLSQLSHGPIAPEDLAELFRVESRRTVWSLRLDGASCTLALDDGQIVLPSAVENFADAVLILDSGASAAMYQFARDLNATLPFTLDPRTPEQRGYVLLRQETIAAVRAVPVEHPADASIGQGFANLLGAGLQLVHLNIRAVRAGDVEGLHQLRVALRRLRSILGVFRPVLPELERRVLNGLLRDAGRQLGPARALDVFLEGILASMRRALPDEPALAQLEAAAIAARQDAYADIPEGIVPTPTLLALEAWSEGDIWRSCADPECRERQDTPLVDFARAALQRRHRRIKRRVACFEAPTVDMLHELRIDVKKARYAAEAFRSLFRQKPVRRYLAGLEALQDVLGALNDASAAQDIAASLRLTGDARRANGLLTGWTASEIERARREFAAAWSVFLEAKPFWRE